MYRFALLLVGVSSLVAVNVWAGNPHFVGDCQIVMSTMHNCLTVSGKEAGLGDEEQIEITLSAQAQCINPGGNAPAAGNKEDVLVMVEVPVQNGKANYAITACPNFQPTCSPPMAVQFSDIVVMDHTNGLECMP